MLRKCKTCGEPLYKAGVTLCERCFWDGVVAEKKLVKPEVKRDEV